MVKKQRTFVSKPEKPEIDPMLDDIVTLLRRDTRSTYAKANVSGLSSSTLNNWMKSKVKHPQSVSIQMAYRMLGYELRRVKIED